MMKLVPSNGSCVRNKFQWIFNRNLYIFISENTFENVVCEIAPILSRCQCDSSTKINFTWLCLLITLYLSMANCCHVVCEVVVSTGSENEWHLTWQHQAINWNNIDLPVSVEFARKQVMSKISVAKFKLAILHLHPHFSETTELTGAVIGRFNRSATVYSIPSPDAWVSDYIW